MSVLLACGDHCYPQDSARNRFGNVFMFEIITTEKSNGLRQPMYASAPDTAVENIFKYCDATSASGIISRSRNTDDTWRKVKSFIEHLLFRKRQIIFQSKIGGNHLAQ